MKRALNILKSERGIGLIVTILILGLIITVFIGNIARMNLTLQETNQRLLRGIAAIQVLQDFGAAAVQANDLSTAAALASAGCPAGTVLVGGAIGPNAFCWPNPLCVQDPRQDVGGTRQFCLDPNGGGAQAQFALIVKPLKEPTVWEQIKQKSYGLLVKVLNASANEAVAQAGRDLDLPNIAGGPSNTVTTPLACTNATPGSQLCKRCVGSGGAAVYNLVCQRIRICLMTGTACDPAVNDNWIFQRFGVSRAPGP